MSFNLFCSGDKIGLYQSSFRNEVDLTNIINVSPNILAKNSNFKKLRHGFVDERALITTTLISSCLWKTLVPFCLRKKRPKNAWINAWPNNTNSELSQNRTEKQIVPFKTTVNWLFTDIRCYLVISCFDWEIVVLRQTVVKVYYIPKGAFTNVSHRVTQIYFVKHF